MKNTVAAMMTVRVDRAGVTQQQQQGLVALAVVVARTGVIWQQWQLGG